MPKHSFLFVFCPSGLLELRSSQGQNPAAFASLSPDFVELTSSVLLAYPKIHKTTPQGGRFVYRGSQIRTDDILLPKQTLYQAELHPEVHPNIAKISMNLSKISKIFKKNGFESHCMLWLGGDTTDGIGVISPNHRFFIEFVLFR